MQFLLKITILIITSFGCVTAVAQSNKPVRGRITQSEVEAKKNEAQNKTEVPMPKAKESKKADVPPPPKKDEPKKAEPQNEQKAAQGNVTKVNTEVDYSFDGIDVSRHQRTIDWDAVAASKKVKYAYIKATEGQSYVDPKYRENIENARRVGVKVGSYHFLRTGSSVHAQFENFSSVVNKNEQDLLPLLDVEVHQGWSSQQMRDSVKVFVDLLEEHYGCKPMIYTGASFFTHYLGSLFLDYPLFIARYASNEPKVPNAKWTLWQFSDRGTVPGISTRVDLSRFNKGCSLRDILIKKDNIGSKKQSHSSLVNTHNKPTKIQPAPTPSKAQEKEDKKKLEKERKAQERIEKLAKEAEAKREKEAKEQAKKEAAKREKEQKELAKKQAAQEKAAREQAARDKAARERAEKEAQKKVDRLIKEEIERQEKAEAQAKEEAKEAAKEAAKQKAIAEKRKQAQQKAQAELDREKAAKTAQQQKKQDQRAKLQQQKANSQNSSATKANSTDSRKRDNKSSADND